MQVGESVESKFRILQFERAARHKWQSKTRITAVRSTFPGFMTASKNLFLLTESSSYPYRNDWKLLESFIHDLLLPLINDH